MKADNLMIKTAFERKTSVPLKKHNCVSNKSAFLNSDLNLIRFGFRRMMKQTLFN